MKTAYRGLLPGLVWNPLAYFPRNMPCFCGSGKKFKRCHKLTMHAGVTPKMAEAYASLVAHVKRPGFDPAIFVRERIRLENLAAAEGGSSGEEQSGQEPKS